MSTIFKNSKNRKTSDPYRLRFNLTDKMDLRDVDQCTALSDLVSTTHGRMSKSYPEK